VEEQKLNRFLGITTRAGWHVTQESTERVREYIAVMKFPTGWPSVSGFVMARTKVKKGKTKKKLKYMKLSERMAIIGDQGLYILGLLDFEDDAYRVRFQNLLRALKSWMVKGPPDRTGRKDIAVQKDLV
jgi:hypothetical protein